MQLILYLINNFFFLLFKLKLTFFWVNFSSSIAIAAKIPRSLAIEVFQTMLLVWPTVYKYWRISWLKQGFNLQLQKWSLTKAILYTAMTISFKIIQIIILITERYISPVRVNKVRENMETEQKMIFIEINSRNENNI